MQCNARRFDYESDFTDGSRPHLLSSVPPWCSPSPPPRVLEDTKQLVLPEGNTHGSWRMHPLSCPAWRVLARLPVTGSTQPLLERPVGVGAGGGMGYYYYCGWYFEFNRLVWFSGTKRRSHLRISSSKEARVFVFQLPSSSIRAIFNSFTPAYLARGLVQEKKNICKEVQVFVNKVSANDVGICCSRVFTCANNLQ